jgi:transcriptional regulator with PAS, ATPase and Fis domain
VNEWTYIRKDGSRVSVLLVVTALVDENGKVTGYLGVAQDINERKRAEDELRYSKKQLEEKIAELEKFNDIAVGRELKMAELKKRIMELEGELKGS